VRLTGGRPTLRHPLPVRLMRTCQCTHPAPHRATVPKVLRVGCGQSGSCAAAGAKTTMMVVSTSTGTLSFKVLEKRVHDLRESVRSGRLTFSHGGSAAKSAMWPIQAVPFQRKPLLS